MSTTASSRGPEQDPRHTRGSSGTFSEVEGTSRAPVMRRTIWSSPFSTRNVGAAENRKTTLVVVSAAPIVASTPISADSDRSAASVRVGLSNVNVTPASGPTTFERNSRSTIAVEPSPFTGWMSCTSRVSMTTTADSTPKTAEWPRSLIS